MIDAYKEIIINSLNPYTNVTELFDMTTLSNGHLCSVHFF